MTDAWTSCLVDEVEAVPESTFEGADAINQWTPTATAKCNEEVDYRIMDPQATSDQIEAAKQA